MSLALATTALVMGLAGGPHCTAMCAAGCAGIVRMGGGSRLAPWLFQAGRLAGYTVAGAVVAEAVQGLSWLAGQTAALRPVWTLFHVAVLAWGLMLLVLARQPLWVSEAGRAAWARLRPVAGARGGLFAAGALWAFMPCGLLYSALLVASLTASAAQGAAVMALFALGSSVSLFAGPWLLLRLREARSGAWGIRLAGLALLLASGWALWMGITQPTGLWCL